MTHSKHTASRARSPWRMAASFLGGLLILVALLSATYVPWRMWASGLDVSYTSSKVEEATGRRVTRDVPARTVPLLHTAPPVESEPSDGALFAYLRVPSFSKAYRLPVWEGTERTVLDNMGAGHYRGTAMPGAVGNAAFAGHNTYADMADIRLLRPGDRVYVETAGHWYAYRVSSDPRVIAESDVEAVLSPGAPGAERGLTLQTCWPIMTEAHTDRRLIVYAAFDGWADKADGTPADLAESSKSVSTRLARTVRDVSRRVDAPVTGVLACCALAVWLVVDGMFWLMSHSRMRGEWRRGGTDPMAWLWRLNAGLFPSNRVAFALTRLVPYLLMWSAVVLACWRWLCPWMAGFIPDLG